MTDSPLKQFIKIQNLQEELDKTKKEAREKNAIVRSLSQKIPEMIRGLKLR